ncbi:MAG: hypothetical protein FWG10_10490 [Eubacteriaceae bacterium]|nr:hypothetical protein [Eubacteriaceae bacterium]
MAEKKSGIKQAELRSVSRASLCYEPHPDEYGLQVKLAIDKIYTAEPWLGNRRLSKWLFEYNGWLQTERRRSGACGIWGSKPYIQSRPQACRSPAQKSALACWEVCTFASQTKFGA